MKYPRKLSSGENNTVIVLNDFEVAKLFIGDTRTDIGSEAEKMKFANTINNLVVKFIRLDYNENLQSEMLVMERLRPIDADLQVPNTAKFEKHTGWKPEIKFEKIMQDLLDYWRDRVAKGEKFLTR